MFANLMNMGATASTGTPVTETAATTRTPKTPSIERTADIAKTNLTGTPKTTPSRVPTPKLATIVESSATKTPSAAAAAATATATKTSATATATKADKTATPRSPK